MENNYWNATVSKPTIDPSIFNKIIRQNPVCLDGTNGESLNSLKKHNFY